MDERLRFIARLLEGEKMAPVCQEFGISRVTGYKIFERYEACGLDGLHDRNRGRRCRCNGSAIMVVARSAAWITTPHACSKAGCGRARSYPSSGSPSGVADAMTGGIASAVRLRA